MPSAAVVALAALLASGACKSSADSQDHPAPPAPPPPGATAKTADDCELFLRKARAALTRMSKAAGVTYTKAIEDQAIVDCRKDLAAGTRARLIDCVLTARDEPAVEACFPRYEELVGRPPGGSPAGGAAAAGPAAAP